MLLLTRSRKGIPYGIPFLVGDSGSEAGMTFVSGCKPGVAGWRLKPASEGGAEDPAGWVKKRSPLSRA